MPLNWNFGRPLQMDHIKLGSGYGPREDHFHEGIDLAAPVGTPVLAIADGIVIKSSEHPDSGLFVNIRHSGGAVSRSMHMSKRLVEKGARVVKGQVIGLSGNTGRSTGPHLHLSLHIDPKLLPQLEAAVGKPSVGYGKLWEVYGQSIPAEPWVPIDEIRLTTAFKLRSYGIPILKDRLAGREGRTGKFWPLVPVGGAVVAALGSVFLGLALRNR